MKKIKKHIIIIIFIALMIIITIGLISTSKQNVEFWNELYNNHDFHYNLITFNSVIAGFLFSGISILVSLISNPSVKRLWDNGYLDNLYISGGLGIILSIISIVMSFLIVLKFDFINKIYVYWTILEIVSAISSLVLFVYCVKELMFSIKVIRRNNH